MPTRRSVLEGQGLSEMDPWKDDRCRDFIVLNTIQRLRAYHLPPEDPMPPVELINEARSRNLLMLPRAWPDYRPCMGESCPLSDANKVTPGDNYVGREGGSEEADLLSPMPALESPGPSPPVASFDQSLCGLDKAKLLFFGPQAFTSSTSPRHLIYTRHSRQTPSSARDTHDVSNGLSCGDHASGNVKGTTASAHRQGFRQPNHAKEAADQPQADLARKENDFDDIVPRSLNGELEGAQEVPPPERQATPRTTGVETDAEGLNGMCSPPPPPPYEPRGRGERGDVEGDCHAGGCHCLHAGGGEGPKSQDRVAKRDVDLEGRGREGKPSPSTPPPGESPVRQQHPCEVVEALIAYYQSLLTRGVVLDRLNHKELAFAWWVVGRDMWMSVLDRPGLLRREALLITLRNFYYSLLSSNRKRTHQGVRESDEPGEANGGIKGGGSGELKHRKTPEPSDAGPERAAGGSASRRQVAKMTPSPLSKGVEEGRTGGDGRHPDFPEEAPARDGEKKKEKAKEKEKEKEVLKENKEEEGGDGGTSQSQRPAMRRARAVLNIVAAMEQPSPRPRKAAVKFSTSNEGVEKITARKRPRADLEGKQEQQRPTATPLTTTPTTTAMVMRKRANSTKRPAVEAVMDVEVPSRTLVVDKAEEKEGGEEKEVEKAEREKKQGEGEVGGKAAEVVRPPLAPPPPPPRRRLPGIDRPPPSSPSHFLSLTLPPPPASSSSSSLASFSFLTAGTNGGLATMGLSAMQLEVEARIARRISRTSSSYAFLFEEERKREREREGKEKKLIEGGVESFVEEVSPPPPLVQGSFPPFDDLPYAQQCLLVWEAAGLLRAREAAEKDARRRRRRRQRQRQQSPPAPRMTTRRMSAMAALSAENSRQSATEATASSSSSWRSSRSASEASEGEGGEKKTTPVAASHPNGNGSSTGRVGWEPRRYLDYWNNFTG
ncbi:unnamed protein product [Phytomonas sp. EM1]|nr:unnamed protein product [Phytomonas sp. EM1]|eukprot:CCW65005.1 unnamed protein product [Phytomonas sp. isolate EM1]